MEQAYNPLTGSCITLIAPILVLHAKYYLDDMDENDSSMPLLFIRSRAEFCLHMWPATLSQKMLRLFFVLRSPYTFLSNDSITFLHCEACNGSTLALRTFFALCMSDQSDWIASLCRLVRPIEADVVRRLSSCVLRDWNIYPYRDIPQNQGIWQHFPK